MKKVIFEEPKNDTVSIKNIKISDPIGFVDTIGAKGHFVYAGCVNNLQECLYHAISLNDRSYGIFSNNKYKSVPEKLQCHVQIKEMYVFDTRKELYKWLSE